MFSVHGPLCGGLGVAIGIYASLGGSGGHVNPAVTLYAVMAGRLGNGLKENLCGFFIYVSAQILGMFFGAVVVYGVFDGQSYEDIENQNLICLFATCPTEKYQLSTVKSESEVLSNLF
jgi:glycerol uptake facilitator-like aquaporin